MSDAAPPTSSVLADSKTPPGDDYEEIREQVRGIAVLSFPERNDVIKNGGRGKSEMARY